ncbi:MAG: hypothetical protein IGS38_02745 [Synechococcales cyanobacterium M58_A2018_015]|nr:hypothetical protein [Synechococcales cyanobacterium M58_A2018_015]
MSPLLHIYGVGGVGKSTLQRRAVEVNPQSVAAVVEFEGTEGSSESMGVMKALHRLQQKVKKRGDTGYSPRLVLKFCRVFRLLPKRPLLELWYVHWLLR